MGTDQEGRTFETLNAKLKEINARLVEQGAAREEAEKLRNANYATIRADFQRTKDSLKVLILTVNILLLYRNLKISTAPIKARLREPTYSQALNQNKIDMQWVRSRESAGRQLWWMVFGVETGREVGRRG